MRTLVLAALLLGTLAALPAPAAAGPVCTTMDPVEPIYVYHTMYVYCRASTDSPAGCFLDVPDPTRPGYSVWLVAIGDDCGIDP